MCVCVCACTPIVSAVLSIHCIGLSLTILFVMQDLCIDLLQNQSNYKVRKSTLSNTSNSVPDQQSALMEPLSSETIT